LEVSLQEQELAQANFIIASTLLSGSDAMASLVTAYKLSIGGS
jgi:hypothetical protein